MPIGCSAQREQVVVGHAEDEHHRIIEQVFVDFGPH